MPFSYVSEFGHLAENLRAFYTFHKSLTHYIGQRTPLYMTNNYYTTDGLDVDTGHVDAKNFNFLMPSHTTVTGTGLFTSLFILPRNFVGA